MIINFFKSKINITLNQFVMKIKKIIYPLYAYKELLFKIRLKKKFFQHWLVQVLKFR